MLIQKLSANEITPALFNGFDRTQIVRRCWRKIDGAWQLLPIAFEEHWTASDFVNLAAELAGITREGGAVLAAMAGNRMTGFAAVRNRPFGSAGQYRQLADLHVSADMRGNGIGRSLFTRACNEARALGAQKLYISAHSSEETIAFYRRIGCTEAQEYDETSVALEPCDCQLEFAL